MKIGQNIHFSNKSMLELQFLNLFIFPDFSRFPNFSVNAVNTF